MSSPGKPTTNTTITVARQHLGAGFRRDTAAPPPPSVSDNHISRIIPVVLLAALSVLAVSVIIYEAPAASAYHGQVTEVWSATLTVTDLGNLWVELVARLPLRRILMDSDCSPKRVAHGQRLHLWRRVV